MHIEEGDMRKPWFSEGQATRVRKKGKGREGQQKVS
jgi:hypothetical protein